MTDNRIFEGFINFNNCYLENIYIYRYNYTHSYFNCKFNAVRFYYGTTSTTSAKTYNDDFVDCFFEYCPYVFTVSINYVNGLFIRKCIFKDCDNIITVSKGTNISNLFMTSCIVSGITNYILNAAGYIISMQINNLYMESLVGFTSEQFAISGGNKYKFINIDGIDDIVYPA